VHETGDATIEQSVRDVSKQQQGDHDNMSKPRHEKVTSETEEQGTQGPSHDNSPRVTPTKAPEMIQPVPSNTSPTVSEQPSSVAKESVVSLLPH